MESQPIEFSWKNANGNNVYAVAWPVAAPVRAVMGLVHGVGEHCRRYDHLARWFGERGIAVIGYDRQGYGRSEGKRGYAANYREFVDEIAQLTLECERRHPDKPTFLYGHSMGGHLLLRYLIRRNPNISAAVVSAPHVQLSFQPSPILVGLGKMMRSVYPTFTQPNPIDLDKLSRSPEVAPAFRADPLTHDKMTARTGIDILENAEILHAYADGINVPTLIMHGDADGVTDYAASKAFAERNGAAFKTWPGLYHELHNEPEQKEVFAFTLNWLEGHLQTVERELKSL